MEKLKGREFQMERKVCSHNCTIKSHRITVFNCITGKVVEERTPVPPPGNTQSIFGSWAIFPTFQDRAHNSLLR
jgi:hypothetical protein